MRDLLQSHWARLLEERHLALFFLLHLIGLHGLSDARSLWVRVPAAACLAASVPFWLLAMRFPAALVGFNGVTLAAILGLLSLSGLWLFLTGAGAVEVTTGFLLTVIGGAGVLFVSGFGWPAFCCLTLAAPALGAGHFFAADLATKLPRLPSSERLVSLLGSLVLTLALMAVLTGDAPGKPHASEPRPRLRDFVTKPAAVLLMGTAAMVGAAAFLRFQPQVRRP